MEIWTGRSDHKLRTDRKTVVNRKRQSKPAVAVAVVDESDAWGAQPQLQTALPVLTGSHAHTEMDMEKLI